MTPNLRFFALTALTFSFSFIAALPSLRAAESPSRPDLNALLRSMTLEEKVGQLTQFNNGDIITGPAGEKVNLFDEIKAGRVGSVLNSHGPKNVHALQRLAIEKTRLRIPLLFGLDVVHGHETISPVPLAEAASWDLAAIETSARNAAREATADGIAWTFAPMVDIARDPRWGRVMEGAGEDPYYGSLVAAARVRGFQTDPANRRGLESPETLLACAKHFAAYGAAIGGRDYSAVDMSERTLREVYLPPFKAAIDAGAGSLMSAFNQLNGVPTTGHPLLRKILHDEWGFRGFVVSDWASIAELTKHSVARDLAHAAELGLRGGVDMDMMGYAYFRSLAELVRADRVPEAEVDAAVLRILEAKAQLGLFEDPYRYGDEKRLNDPAQRAVHRAAARALAAKTMVLLKNEYKTLPLSPDSGGGIAVIGALAKSARDPLGEWVFKGDDKQAVTLWDGLAAAVGKKRPLTYAPGYRFDPVRPIEKDGPSLGQRLPPPNGKPTADDLIAEAVTVAKNPAVTVIVAVVGEHCFMSGEAASRTDLNLPGSQENLLRALHATGKPVVAVLLNGRPLTIPWLDANLPAILEAWLPGSEAGHAVADVLFGQVNPSGKLPVTFPRTLGQVPIFYAAQPLGRPLDEKDRYTSKYLDAPNTPLYPFGYGLSYTTFTYGKPTLDRSALKLGANETIRASVTLKNTGPRAGREVVQFYLRDLVASIARPVQELKGFQLVELAAGETCEVVFEITPAMLSFLGPDWKPLIEPGEFEVMIGGNSRDVQRVKFLAE